MINKQLKLKAKIPNGSKVVAFTRNYTKFSSFRANMTLKVKVTSLSVKAKFRIYQCKSLKQVFYKFGGQSDLEGQDQGHKFLK